MSRPWFAPKPYGFGGTPTTWQGWSATTVFVVTLGATVALVPGWPRWACGAALAVGFAVLACAKTDGGCRWRWGGL